MAVEKTLVLVKPDGVRKHICGEIISRFERKGLALHAVKMVNVSVELAKKHYGEHEGKPFFQSLIDFITSGPVLAMVIEGNNAVAAVRQINGATDPLKAASVVTSVPASMKTSFMHPMLRKLQQEKSDSGSRNCLTNLMSFLTNNTL